MTQELWGQILGFVATAVITSAYQANTKKGMLMIQTPGVVVLCVSYLLLGAISGFALNIACVLRNVCCIFVKEKSKGYYIMTGVLMCAIGALGVLSWEGYLSLILIVALVANTFFVALGKPQILRYSLVVTSSMCLAYNACLPIPSFGGILLEAITVASAIVGIVRFWRNRKKQASVNAAP
ncbi:MAG: YgjV family protein [Clostridia bacterium]|nr:YgjV family protein [Clostridia bacterium]